MADPKQSTEKQAMATLDESRIPRVLILRGARERTGTPESFGRYFHNVESLRLADRTNQELLLGERYGVRCVLAWVYGASMTQDIVHCFGQLGLTMVLHTGCCTAKVRRIQKGDLFMATEAYQDNGTHGYSPQVHCVKARYDGAELSALQAIRSAPVHWGRVYSAKRDHCIESHYPEGPLMPGCWAVDRETATVFSASERYGMYRMAILYVAQSHQPETPAAQHACRRCGEELLFEVLLAILKSYSEKLQSAGLQDRTSNEFSAEQKRRLRFWQAAVDSKM